MLQTRTFQQYTSQIVLDGAVDSSKLFSLFDRTDCNFLHTIYEPYELTDNSFTAKTKFWMVVRTFTITMKSAPIISILISCFFQIFTHSVVCNFSAIAAAVLRLNTMK